MSRENRIAVCSVCGPTKIKIKKHGVCCWTKILEWRKRWRKSPNAKAAARLWRNNKKYDKLPYRKHVKMVCERCGFKAADPCQMDGHHKDRNRKNNSPENIESLCAMCHRMVHKNLEHLITPMDTSKFDQKMKELREAATNGTLTKESVDMITKQEGPKEPVTKPKEASETLGLGNPIVSPEIGQVNELKAQIKLLLEDNDRLSKELATVEHRLSRVARLTDNEKLILWIRKYDELKKVYDELRFRMDGLEH